MAYPVVDVVGEESSGDGTGSGDEANGREARLDLHPCLSGLSLASVFGEVVDSLRRGDSELEVEHWRELRFRGPRVSSNI